jgi:hypothetical protein
MVRPDGRICSVKREKTGIGRRDRDRRLDRNRKEG